MPMNGHVRSDHRFSAFPVLALAPRAFVLSVSPRAPARHPGKHSVPADQGAVFSQSLGDQRAAKWIVVYFGERPETIDMGHPDGHHSTDVRVTYRSHHSRG